MMTDRIYARALALAGAADAGQQEILRILCEAACASYEARLREGMLPEDCGEMFVTAAAMEAVAMLGDFEETAEFKAGDLTLKQPERRETATRLRHQAQQIMGPYLKDAFLFVGV